MSEQLLQQILIELQGVRTEMTEFKGAMNTSLEKVHSKLDSIADQVVHNTETLEFVKEQTATNTESM